MLEIKNIIDGKEVEASSGLSFANFYPATNEQIARVAKAGQLELESALENGKKAQKQWLSMSRDERSRILFRASEILRERNDELAELEVRDTGKPISEASVEDVVSAADCVEYFSKALLNIEDERIQLGHNYADVIKVPMGVVAGIGAWNYPIQIAAWKSAPALAAGNAMIYKPSELTPMSANKLAEIYIEAGVPAGLFNVLHGEEELGRLLVDHPEIRKISLTGEAQTGVKVMEAAAKNLKRLTLELGGKSPLIVFDDADIDNAVQGAMIGNFYTQGEICTNGTRVFVHESVKEKFLENLLLHTGKLVIGDPMDPATHVGSLISKDHLRKVKNYVTQGVEEGAKLLCGGNAREDLGGNYFEPTVFDECTDEMTIIKEEIFGPVLSLLTFKDEDEVIRRANNTPYGLAGGVFTKDNEKAQRVSRALDVGICWINSYNMVPIEIPVGGMKLSGIGRENSMLGLESYLETRTIYTETADLESPYRL